MKKTLGLCLILLSALFCMSCASSNKTDKAQKSNEPAFEQKTSLAELASKYGFKMGGCISYNSVGNAAYMDMLSNNFTSITATNEFKAYSLLNQMASAKAGKPVMDYRNADTIAKFAKAYGLQIRGHVLVWDAYMCDWFFREDFDPKKPFVDSDTMKERLRYYINDVITHFETLYPGLVYCWDVVNEAVADGANEAIPGNPYYIRKTRSGTSNIFNDVIGPDYVLFAFQCARDTVDSLGADIKLFYNDYNTYQPAKRENIKRLITYINSERKLCDGVGMQGYIGGYGQQSGCMNINDLVLIKNAIQTYSDIGVEVQMTEVAVRNYQNDEQTMKYHAKFYGQLIKTLIEAKQNGANFTALTIWGLCDAPHLDKSSYSYKMNGPYCGLFTEDIEIKDSYIEVYKALE